MPKSFKSKFGIRHVNSFQFYLAGQCLLSEGSPLLDLGVGELREVGHHGLLVHVGVDDLLGGQQLRHPQPAVSQVHRLRGIPATIGQILELSTNPRKALQCP